MSVWLTYMTTHPVSPALRAAVVADWGAIEASQRHQWWVVPPTLFAGTADVALAGETATHDGAEDIVRFVSDVRLLIDRLHQLAVTHSLEWELVMLGHPLGSITAAGPSDDVRAWLDVTAREIVISS
jgi:hypothetical protein